MKAPQFARMLALTSFPLVAGCTDPTGFHGSREIGIVEWIYEAQTSLSQATAGSRDVPAVITAPDEVEAGVPFDATITTIGPTTCWRADGAETQVSANVAVVIPYDFTPESADLVCGTAISELPRTVTITFASPGEALLRVEGRKVVGGDTSASSSAVVEKRILVR